MKQTYVTTEFDEKFAKKIIEAGGEQILSCFQCGSCTGGCPSGRLTNLSTRLLIRKALLGLKDEVLQNDALWYCTTCYTCYERCPRDVKPTEVIKSIRNIAVQEGYMKEKHRAVALKALTTGHAVPLDKESWMNLREKLGLRRRPPNASTYEKEVVDEIQKICKITGFDKLVEKEQNKEE